MVVSVGIDVSKDKHDCFIVSSEGEVLADVFTISNTMDGFNCLLQRIQNCTTPQDKTKVGLEATGHYSYNLLGFLLDNGLTTYLFFVVIKQISISDLCMAENLDLPLCLTVQSFFIAYI